MTAGERRATAWESGGSAGGMYHMIALPHRVRHQQFGAQLQTQLNGL